MAKDKQQTTQAPQDTQTAPSAPAPAPARPVKKKKKKGWIAAVIIIVVLAGVGGGIAACSKSLSDSLQQMSAGAIEVAKVEKRDIEDYISVSGKVESENLVKITSTVTAKVKNVFVEVGSEVKEGDILCEFDSSDFQQQYDTLAKTLENADGMTASSHKINQRNLENAKNERKIALEQADRAITNAKKARDDAHKKEKDLVEKYNTAVKQRDEANENMKNTLQSDVTAAQQYAAQVQEKEALASSLDSQIQALREQFDTFDSAVQSAQDAYDSTKRNYDAQIQNYQDVLDNEKYNNDNSSTQNELDKLKDKIEQCTVRATKPGIVTSLNIAEGSIPTTDALMTIENTDALKITVSIAEQDILKIHEGMKATVKTNATGDEEFDATVTRVVNIYKADNSASAMMSGSSSSGGYSAEVTIDDKNTDLLIGMNAKVKIMLQSKQDVLAVPYESILTDEEDESEDPEQYVLLAITGDDNVTRAKKAAVKSGMEGNYYTEITSDEVKEGDKIVITPGDYKDGDVLPIFDFNAALNKDKKSDEGGKDE